MSPSPYRSLHLAELLQRLQSALGDAYTVERELGGGGMSRLFLATEASLHRQVVIKLLPPEFASEVSAARFKQEIEVAAHLQHPNILPVLAAGAKDDLLFYVMPFVSGESLRHRLTREGKLPVADAVRVLHEVADALAHAHAEGVIHRDIKPENILLLGGHAVLTDFGVARAIVEAQSGGRLTETGMAVGTPGYMSPEQAAGERHLDARADVYALAVVGYEMLAGRPPFAGPTAQAVIAAHLMDTPTPLAELRPEAPTLVGDAIARALAKDPNERLRTAAEFRDALGASIGQATGAGLSRRARLALGGAAVVLVAVLGLVLFRPKAAGVLDPNLVAVAPFDVLAPQLELWREGLVDVLSRNLDGAGPLRTVAPTITIHRWGGRADPASAAALGRNTGAARVVFGTVTAEGRDSVRVSAAVADVRSGRVVAEVERRDAADRINRLVDSLTLDLLHKISLGTAAFSRPGAVGTTSLPALKEFLQGEQHFRRTAWDSALAAYRRAAATDTAFALAWWRMGTVSGWQTVGGDSLSQLYSLRAAVLNHGLAPRESLLIVADSLMTALFTSSGDTEWRAHQARLYTTLEAAARRYPEDPEVWDVMGEASVHFQRPGRMSGEEQLRIYDRAIALDSSRAPTYIHAIELSVQALDLERARRFLDGYLALSSTDKEGTGLRLADAVLRGAPGVERIIDTASAHLLFDAWLTLRLWPDSSETSVRLARALVASRRSEFPIYNSTEFRNAMLAEALATRGHLAESYRLSMASVRGERGRVFTARIAPLGGVPAESAATLFHAWLQHPPLAELQSAVPNGFNVAIFDALPWWAAAGDTASLTAFARMMDSIARSSRGDLRPWLFYGSSAARAYYALAAGDSSEALRRFQALPDTICSCIYDRIVAVQLLTARGRWDDGEAVFEHHEPHWGELTTLWRLERGRVREHLGRKTEALADYRYVAQVWRAGDPELQKFVAEARAGVQRLSGESR